MSRNLLQACLVVFAAIIIGTILTMDGYELFVRLEGNRAIYKSIERRKLFGNPTQALSTTRPRPRFQAAARLAAIQLKLNKKCAPRKTRRPTPAEALAAPIVDCPETLER